MTTITMPSRRQTARQRCKWAAACGELDAMGMLIDQLATSAGRSGGHAMRRQRLSPTMTETLIAMLNRNAYPAYENNSRTFASLEERGLIQPDIEGNWSLTDTGHQTALKLLKR